MGFLDRRYKKKYNTVEELNKMKNIFILFIFSITISFCQTYPGTMIEITGGSFIMGNNNQPPMFNDQDPEHSVTVDNFKMGQTEVPNEYYVIFLNDMVNLGNLIIEEGIPGDWSSTPEEIANGHAWSIMADSTLSDVWSGEVLIKLSDIAGGGQHPLNRCWIEVDTTSYTFSVVEGYENWPASWVSWYGAMMYVDYYSLTLPTEAEWEYAARAGQQLEYPTNDGNLSYSQANYGTGFGGPSGETYLTPVGELYPPNPFGLYNMAGNVSEWCLDWYDENFYQFCVDNNIYLNPINDNISEDNEKKVLRGGNHTYPGFVAMSSSRTDTPPFVTTDHMGFRVVMQNSQEEFNMEIQTDWNLVGLPIEVEDPYYLTIFPNAIENTLFSFDDTYTTELTLIFGEGYWLRFNEEGSTTISGTPINELAISLNEGWNLISGISTPMIISDIQDPDGIIILGTIYGFTSGGYSNTENIEPGKGYWVRTNGFGSITLIGN